jgi:hypothetical protein
MRNCTDQLEVEMNTIRYFVCVTAKALCCAGAIGFFAQGVLADAHQSAGTPPEGAKKDSKEGKKATGSCTFTQKNMFAGPFKVCLTPTDKAGCEATGSEDENSAAAYSMGPCKEAGVVGTCTRDNDAVIYYTGDPDGLSIGCGFQGGDWKTAG